MNMSSTGSQLSFEDNDMFNLNSDYLGHIFNHDINNIENSAVEKKIDIAQLYNEKETFQNNLEKFQTKMKLPKTNSDNYVNIKNNDPTKNSLEKMRLYYFMMYLFFLWLCFFLFYVSCFF